MAVGYHGGRLPWRTIWHGLSISPSTTLSRHLLCIYFLQLRSPFIELCRYSALSDDWYPEFSIVVHSRISDKLIHYILIYHIAILASLQGVTIFKFLLRYENCHFILSWMTNDKRTIGIFPHWCIIELIFLLQAGELWLTWSGYIMDEIHKHDIGDVNTRQDKPLLSINVRWKTLVH